MAEQSDTDKKLVRIVGNYKRISEDAYRSRRMRNLANRQAYDGEQDFSMKIPGQSTEFLPKTSQTVEQMVAFLKRGLTQFGDWFAVELGKGSPLSNDAARAMIMNALDRLPAEAEDETVKFVTVLCDALKSALLETEMIFKVHGAVQERSILSVEAGKELTKIDLSPWTLRIDAIPPDLYNRDPTGRGLWRIHTVERDLYQVKAWADAGIYDPDVIDAIRGEMELEEEKRRDKNTHDQQAFRRVVTIDECYGTLVDERGDVVESKCLLAIANDKYLIRKPEKYPYWHESHPFVEIPIIRRPFSSIHRALYDDVVPLNIALNELFNLMLDGGLSSVWGVRQVRPNLLEDPDSISDGIPANRTLVLSDTAPMDARALDVLTEGKVPQDAIAMFQILSESLNAAAKTNEISLGQLPGKQVRATEVVQAEQSASAVLDSLVADIEAGIEKVIRKAWLTMLQNADELATDELNEALTRKEMLALAQMSPGERFATMGSGSSVKVTGLSATLSKARDFQKIMALLQATATNPILFNAMLRRFSGDKILTKLMRVLNINPMDLERGEDEDGAAEVNNVMGMLGKLNPKGSESSMSATGEPGMQSEITQEMQPSQVM